MKKIILGAFLITGILGFSRFVEECEITSKGTYRNGKGYVTCQSYQSGKYFNFVGVSYRDRSNLEIGEVYTVYFEGEGYRNLRLTDYYYTY